MEATRRYREVRKLGIKRDKKKYYCAIKGCTKQVWRKGMCKSHLNELKSSDVKSQFVVPPIPELEKLKTTLKPEPEKWEKHGCKCVPPMQQMGDECVIKLYEGAGGYGAVKVYHRNNLLHSAIGLIERVKTEKEN